ncbi:MAG: glycosyltransferase [Martelella sp.]|uniref:glycosyltransferase n=1 Tax=Martelella sp. TaxID=1969699 RepID=UPI003242AF6B
MRILVFSSYWPRPTKIHNATFETQQVAALTEAGHHVDVVVQTPPWRRRATFLGAAELGLDPVRVQVRQIVVPRLPEILGRYPLGIRMNIRTTGHRVKDCIEAYVAAGREPDLVIVHGERNVGLSAGIWNRSRKWPTAVIVHGADPALEAAGEEFLHLHVGALANAGMSRIILVGNRLRTYARHLGYDEQRITVIPNGFSQPRPPFRPSGHEVGAVRMVSVARLVPVKGIDDTLHALAALSERNPNLEWSYDIAGDGPERGMLQELTKDLSLEARVRFLGSMPNQDVLRLLERSAIFVLPSWNEAFGLAYLEAMAMGATVVGCFENGAADIITDGVDGCLVPPRNIDSLSRVLEDLITNPHRREALSGAAMQSVRRFSWSDNARAVIEAIQYD